MATTIRAGGGSCQRAAFRYSRVVEGKDTQTRIVPAPGP